MAKAKHHAERHDPVPEGANAPAALHEVKKGDWVRLLEPHYDGFQRIETGAVVRWWNDTPPDPRNAAAGGEQRADAARRPADDRRQAAGRLPRPADRQEAGRRLGPDPSRSRNRFVHTNITGSGLLPNSKMESRS